jgi:hypothetical protein
MCKDTTEDEINQQLRIYYIPVSDRVSLSSVLRQMKMMSWDQKKNRMRQKEKFRKFSLVAAVNNA